MTTGVGACWRGSFIRIRAQENKNMPPRSFPAMGRALAMACLAIAFDLLPVAPARAAALVYSDWQLSAAAEAFDPFDVVIEDRPSEQFVPVGSSIQVEALLEPSVEWRRAPMSTSSLPGAFVSAAVNGMGDMAVGVSGFRRGGPNGNASLAAARSIENNGTTSAYLDITWTLPGMEVTMGDTDSFDALLPSGYPFASVRAALGYTILDSVGTIVEFGYLFDYSAQLIKDTRDADDIQLVFESEDLQRLTDLCDATSCLRSLVRETIAPHEIAGYRYGPITSKAIGLEILPQHTLGLSYLMNAQAYGGDPSIVDDIDLSIQAVIGDPLDLRASSTTLTIRESVEPPGPTPVPTPSSALLVATVPGLLRLISRRVT